MANSIIKADLVRTTKSYPFSINPNTVDLLQIGLFNNQIFLRFRDKQTNEEFRLAFLSNEFDLQKLENGSWVNTNRVGGNFLTYGGSFTGDINSLTIPSGIYSIGSASSYTHTDFDNGGITVPSYCVFIQLPYYNTQIFLTGYLIIRKHTGSPARWRTNQIDYDKTYLES